MITFLQLWERLVEESDNESMPLQGSGIDSKAMHAIKTGLNLRNKEGCGNFWDDFLEVCNNSDGLAELLNVQPEQVNQWASRVRDILHKVRETESQQLTNDKKMFSTGNSEPLADLRGAERSPEGTPRFI